MSRLTCFAHRGASGYEPENTLRSFRRAIDMGCRWIELDVYAVDGELLVIHDDDLSRTTDGRGKVSTSTFDYLRSLDAGKGERIPTLAEVFEMVDRRCGINIELKGHGTARPVSSFLAEQLARGWDTQQVILSSFDHRELALTDPSYPRGALCGRSISYAKIHELAASSLNIPLRLANEATIESAHAENLRVYVYTVNQPSDIRRMMAIGVDGVFSDYPDRVLAQANED